MVNGFTDTINGSIRNHGKYSYNFSFAAYLNNLEDVYENSVIPLNQTLKHELPNNRIKRLSIKQYYNLLTDCSALLQRYGHSHKARYIGVNNKKCNIPEGTRLTINHMIALKVCTEYFPSFI